MAMSPEEKRQRERERKARQRAEKREAAALEALPQIGPRSRAQRGTKGGTFGGTESGTAGHEDLDRLSNSAAAAEVIADLDVPKWARWRVALILQLASDLDAPMAIPQRAGLAARYEANLEALIAACKPRERDELDELRRSFYRGGVDGIDDDPEAPQRRTVRNKA